MPDEQTIISALIILALTGVLALVLHAIGRMLWDAFAPPGECEEEDLFR